MSAKSKVYIGIAVWVGVAFIMYSYFFDILANSNKVLAADIARQQAEQAVLKAEWDSYKKAENDLSRLAKSPVQPEDFFSQDVALVNELRVLEGLGNRLGVDFALSGLSGTAKSAAKAKTKSDIAVVGYSLRVTGPFPNVVAFIETMENLAFITNLNSLSLAAAGNNVTATISANFYLKRF